VDAVVMAAGEGRRLRPLTDHWPKPILPIDGRPVIITLLEELGDAGCPRAWVVVGHLGDQVVRLLEDNPPIPVDFVRQPEPLGSADAVQRALDVGAESPVLVCAADTVFAPGDIRRVIEAAGPAVAWRRSPPGTTITVKEGRVVKVPGDPTSDRFASPLWVLTADVARLLDDLPGPPFELSQAFQRAIDAGTTVAGIEIQPTRDLTEPADLVRHNFLYLEKSDE
jgi:UDP-N-acetylglucosamine diphosphorylase / glucose-1-phosphate thymidylyltransferase / UDP-N-acetylgalactosamine diphosphorylase / glucosamine-1-phosphate N-acetyltransferase / galactosamine-1-phosphate N-acetyltransferase